MQNCNLFCLFQKNQTKLSIFIFPKNGRLKSQLENNNN